jgi:hypothetical protein
MSNTGSLGKYRKLTIPHPNLFQFALHFPHSHADMNNAVVYTHPKIPLHGTAQFKKAARGTDS